jgi:hypothetical protein
LAGKDYHTYNDFTGSDVAAVVLVKVLECLQQVLLAIQLAEVHGGRQELLIVDAAVAVDVNLVQNLLHLLLRQRGALLPQALTKLFHGDGAAVVNVQ